MQEKPDAQLLRAYLQGDESAFPEIVSRHTDLVYSAALRQVNSQALAKDIAQSVFVDLVRKSKELNARMEQNASLAGWLYRSTRFAALNHLRDEHRRAENERQAMEQLITDTSPAADWERIRPLLDEAMAELSDDDRDALLLRYFKNHDFRTVGRGLGLSDDAAQKRVTRAVERLREFFSKRGVAIGASGLAVLISANAIQAAPAGLAAAVTATLAGTVVSGVTTTHLALSWIVMKTTTVIIIGAATAATITYLVLHNKANHLEAQNQALIAQQAKPAPDQNAAPVPALAKATQDAPPQTDPNEVLRLRGQVGALRQESKELGQLQTQTRTAQSQQISEEIKKNVGQLTITARLLTDFFSSKTPLTNINQLKAVPGGLSGDIDLDKFEIVSNPVPVKFDYPEVILLREKTPRQTPGGKWTRVYGMVDGSAIEQISADGNFDAWEKQHLMPAQKTP